MNTYTNNQMRAMCDLYKVLPTSARYAEPGQYHPEDQIKYGLVFVGANMMPVTVDRHLFDIANSLYGIDPNTMTNTFYKSFKTVTEKTRFEIFVDQIIHYLGTYGMESLGCDPITIIPCQKLEVPDVDLTNVKVTVIRLVTDGQIVNLINGTLATVKAPSQRIAENVEALIRFADMDLDDIRSFELAVMAWDYFQTPPRAGKNVLRYIIYKLTSQTLLIKNKRTVKAIEDAAFNSGRLVYDILSRTNPVEMAAIFLRYKPLFLAMKKHEGCAPLINKYRRMADTYHKPLDANTVQNYIQFAIQGKRGPLAEIRKKMDRRDMVKVINAMLVRLGMKDGDPAVYNVRNGRSFCVETTSKGLTRGQTKALELEMQNLYSLLTDMVSETVKGKTFYIPSYIEYAVPQSEKQFVGNIPWGTFLLSNVDGAARKDVTIGVSWTNQGKNGEVRVDLDLHAFNENQHFGWNSSFTDGSEVIYSGDMTNAPLPLGAAEAFYVSGISKPVIFTLNKYCGPDEMPFKLYMSDHKVKTFDNWEGRIDHPYTMNPNELIMAPIPMKFFPGENGMTLGFLVDGNFCFYSGNLSNGAVPKGNYAKYLEAVTNQQELHLNMAGLLSGSHAMIVRTEEEYNRLLEKGVEVIDLTPEALTATTLLDILEGK